MIELPIVKAIGVLLIGISLYMKWNSSRYSLTRPLTTIGIGLGIWAFALSLANEGLRDLTITLGLVIVVVQIMHSAIRAFSNAIYSIPGRKSTYWAAVATTIAFYFLVHPLIQHRYLSFLGLAVALIAITLFWGEPRHLGSRAKRLCLLLVICAGIEGIALSLTFPLSAIITAFITGWAVASFWCYIKGNED